MRQRLAAGIPFFHQRFGNAPSRGKGMPPMVDLSSSESRFWRQLRGLALKGLPYYPNPPIFQSTIRAYDRNQTQYQQSQLDRTTTVLDVYDSAGMESPVLSLEEIRQLQGRLAQAQKLLGIVLDPDKLERLYVNEKRSMRVASSGNWELLRQKAEAEGLYFDPLSLPDGTATHALLWIAREDLERNRQKSFNGRFLNIGRPWGDKALLAWDGVTETRFFDAENRLVTPGTLNARAVDLIPLALYGLDHPKIPMLLVDFRKPLNAKRRELSGRVRDAIANSVFPVSTLASLGDRAIGFFTRRKGSDIFQPSRSRSYARLKTLLSMQPRLSPAMRAEVAGRIESVADNPFENDLKTELKIAREQYESLLAYASRADGLRARLQLDRRAEMAAGTHGRPAKALFKMAKMISLGTYTHREQDGPELEFVLKVQRRDARHEQFLREVIKSGPDIEVNWDTEKVRGSLHYIASYGTVAPDKVARIAAQILVRTHDELTRDLCLQTIRDLGTPVAEETFAGLYDPSVKP
jgi:hypothetical protein